MNKQTAVEWLNEMFRDVPKQIFDGNIWEQAKEMERHQQDTFAIDFAEWYENDVLAKGDYEMIAKDKKELLKIFKETYGNNKQTAVDRLIQILIDRGFIAFPYTLPQSTLWNVVEQAKEMEKQQIIDATCLNEYVNEDDREIGERYYKQEYGGEK